MLALNLNKNGFLNSRWVDGFAKEVEDSLLNQRRTWSVPVDIHESNDNYEISLDIPGVEKKNVNVEIDNGLLWVRGSREESAVRRESKVHRTEKFYGEFSRSFKLPEDIDEEKIEAKFEHGVLQLTVPKTEAKKPKKISIV